MPILPTRNIHRPRHIYVKEAIYFLTGRLFSGVTLDDSNKKIFQEIFFKLVKEFNIQLFNWILLPNHYHLLFSFGKYELGFKPIVDNTTSFWRGIISVDNLSSCAIPNLGEFVRKVHSKTTVLINKNDGVSNRKLWYQYWDYCIRNESDFWKHFNYILQNAVKHGLVTRMHDYEFSGFQYFLDEYGLSWLAENFKLFPIRDFLPAGFE